jgi:hypothetical protein
VVDHPRITIIKEEEEGYAAIQRGGRAACSGGWGQSYDS